MTQINAMETSYLSAVNIVAMQDIVNNRTTSVKTLPKLHVLLDSDKTVSLIKKRKNRILNLCFDWRYYICYEGRNFTLEVKQLKTPLELSLFMMRSFLFLKCFKRGYFHTFARSLNSDLRSSQRGSEPQHLQCSPEYE